MKSLHCLRGRPARIIQSLPARDVRVTHPTLCRPAITLPSSSSYASQLLGHHAPARPYSTVVDIQPKASETSTDVELSDYRRRRLEQLSKFQGGEEGLFTELYPRLKHRTKSMLVEEFVDTHEETETYSPDSEAVTLYGRVRSIRTHGTFLMFIDIENQFHSVQAMVNWKTVTATSGITKKQFKLFSKLIEKGDHISVTGRPKRTIKGQLSIEATDVPELLSPAVEPIPDVLTDPDKKAQNRHLDMIVNREAVDTLRLRNSIVRYLRSFLERRNFEEFQTPIVSGNAGGAIARPFVTLATEFPSKELALRIAPELWLKRLVVGGVHNVYEIGPAFRNEGIDGTHNPEFTMCEFYSAYKNLADLILMTEDMVRGLAGHCNEAIRDKLTSLPPVDVARFADPFRIVEFVPGLEAALGLTLPNLAGESALPDMIALLKLAGVHIPGETPSTLPKLLDRLAAMYLEPQSHESALFITHHPACMSPLSKSFICPRTGQEVAARAELFYNGRELANMYEEENDPELQLWKMMQYRLASIEARRKDHVLHDASAPDQELGADTESESVAEVAQVDPEAPPVDRSYIRALRAGLPPTGGWGCGIERLVMLFSQAKRISDCLSFGTLNNVVSLNPGSDGGPPPREAIAPPESRDRVEKLSKRLLESEVNPEGLTQDGRS